MGKSLSVLRPAQLKTNSKILVARRRNSALSQILKRAQLIWLCPVFYRSWNKGAVEKAIQFGLAVGATIAPESIFARKNYFYPDLPKGYQISQFEIPVVQGGSVSCVVEKDGKQEVKTIPDTRPSRRRCG